jgi:hypothetical protein
VLIVAIAARPIVIGVCVFAIGSIAVLVLPFPFGWLAYAPAFLAGAVTSFFARDERICPLLILGCANAAVTGVLNLAVTPFGLTDFPGWWSSWFAAAVSLPFILVLGLIGGAIVGVWQRGTHA